MAIFFLLGCIGPGLQKHQLSMFTIFYPAKPTSNLLGQHQWLVGTTVWSCQPHSDSAVVQSYCVTLPSSKLASDIQQLDSVSDLIKLEPRGAELHAAFNDTWLNKKH